MKQKRTWLIVGIGILAVVALTLIKAQEQNQKLQHGTNIVAYNPPISTPYKHKPVLEHQYLKAHRAGWNSVILSVSPSRISEAIKNNSMILTHQTTCEATRNVTRGSYRGQDDGNVFIKRLIGRGKIDRSILKKYKQLVREIKKNPVIDWYIFDGYNPKEVITEVDEVNGVRIEKDFRDKTRTKLLEIRRYQGNLLHGFSESFDANGELAQKAPFEYGKMDGIQIYYSDTGVILGKTPHVRGEKHGIELWYDEAGDLIMYREWVHGRRHGRHIQWYEGGTLSRFYTWENDKKNGCCVSYQPNQKHIAEGAEYSNDAVVKQFESLAPVSILPEEYNPVNLAQFRFEHSREDQQK